MEKTQTFIGTPVHHLRKDRTRRFSVAFHSYVGLSVGTGSKWNEFLLSQTAPNSAMTVQWLTCMTSFQSFFKRFFKFSKMVFLKKRWPNGLTMGSRWFQDGSKWNFRQIAWQTRKICSLLKLISSTTTANTAVCAVCPIFLVLKIPLLRT